VFAGGFALDGAETVGAGDDVSSGEVLDLLGHLVDKSLVALDAQDGRYYLLETVRQYALERLAASVEEGRTRDRHLGYYVALAERSQGELYGPKQVAWAARLDAERENILLAFDRARIATGGGAAGLAMVYGFNQWFGWTHPGLWHRVILEALAHPDAQQEDVARGRALYVAYQVCSLTGRHDEGFALAQSSVRIARACGDLHMLAEALYRLGVAATDVDRGADAREHFVEGIALARQTGNQRLLASLSNGLGELYSHQGGLETAEPHYLEALGGCSGDPAGALWTLSLLARNAIALRAEAKAVRYLREAVATGAARHSILTTQPILMCCSGLAALREEWAFALRLSGAAASHREQHGLLDDYLDAQFDAASMAPAREALGADAADAAFAAGRAMSADAALREAEDWLNALPGV
jgi:tetratricopeptide (TPR) repeat protein